MSLTAFQRYRRMKQVEEMKPENIVKEEPKVIVPIEKAPVVEKVEIKKEPEIKEVKEEVSAPKRRNSRTSRKS